MSSRHRAKSDDGWHDRDRRGLPVMFWIHGGGLINGSSTPYNPEQFVKKGVIVVTINYRLGFLGFFAQSAIDAEGHLSGNYGLMDQQFALGWVRRNIASFGGDPDRVTIFGESAGGQSVYAHLASPLVAGMFRGAISESGSYAEFQNYFSNIVTLTWRKRRAPRPCRPAPLLPIVSDAQTRQLPAFVPCPPRP